MTLFVLGVPLCREIEDDRPSIRCKYTNFWRGFDASSPLLTWLAKGFLLNNKSLCISDSEDYDVHLLSVFGKFGWSTTRDSSRFFLLYSGENPGRKHATRYFLRSNASNVAVISHEYPLGRPHVFRVPFWFFRLGLWDPHGSPLQYLRANMRSGSFVDRPRQVAIINSHALVGRGLKGEARTLALSKLLEQKIAVDRPGKFANNMPSLDQVNMTKHDFLLHYYFNLCPENSYRRGYITEKLFDAAFAGCIPIYWGDPECERGVLNRDRIIYYSPSHEGTRSMATQVSALLKSPQELKKFWELPIFSSTALDSIRGYDETLQCITERILSWFSLQRNE